MSPVGSGVFGTTIFGGEGEETPASPPPPSDEDFPTVVTEVAFATLPGSSSPVWTDVSAWVHANVASSARRNRETDRYEAGRFDGDFDNSDGRFGANNTASPHYPNVLPMRRIRQRATFGGVTYDLFDGYVEDWPSSFDYPAVASVSVKATDASIALGSIPIEGTPFDIEVRRDSPVAWWPLSDAAGDGVMTDKAGTFDGGYEGKPTSGTIDAGSSMQATYFARAETDKGVYTSTVGAPIGGYPFTIEAVVKPDPEVPEDPTSTNARRYVVQLRDFTSGAYGIDFQLLDNAGVSGIWPAGLGGHVGVYISSAGQARAVRSAAVIDDGREHHVMLVCASASSALLFVDGVQDSVVEVAGTPSFPAPPTVITIGNRLRLGGARAGFSGAIANVVLYNTALASDRIAAHYVAFRTAWKGDLTGTRAHRILDAAGWSTVDRAIDSGHSTMQAASTLTGSALELLQQVAETENGAVFVTRGAQVRFRDRHSLLLDPQTPQATFTDQGGSDVDYDEIVPDFAVDAIRNDAQVSRAGGIVQRVIDATSIGKFFRRRYTKTGLLFEKDGEARDHGQWIVRRSANPPFRYSKLVVTAYGNEAAMFPLMLGRHIGDRIRVAQQPPGETSPVFRDLHIDGITHRIGPGKTWSTEFQLTPVDDTDYFVLGTSVLGGTDILGY